MFYITVHASQIILRFTVENGYLELSYLQQYFPGATGLVYFDEEGFQFTILANEDNLISIDQKVKDYSVSYKSSKIIS